MRQQWIDQESSLKGVPRPWGSTINSALPGSAGSVLEPSILPVPKGQWYIATWLRWSICKTSPGLASLAEVGERAWVPDTQAVWMARPRNRWLWGAVASRMSRGQGACTHTLAQNRGLCFARIVGALGEPRAVLTTLVSLWWTGHTAQRPLPAQGHGRVILILQILLISTLFLLSTPGNGGFRAVLVP